MPMPNIVYEHKELLTLNTRELPIYEDAVPGIPGIDSQPLFIDTHSNVWVLRIIFKPGVLMPVHYHTGTVHLWTLSGKWYYLEYPDQPQTAGCYLYEPGGSVHQFTTPADNTEPTEVIMVVSGANINFDQDGNYLGVLDASEVMSMIDHLIRERGLQPARYITPAGARYSDES
ncbi:2,4'-dihydroxyacetophenone dioxygenase family protein [Zestomonas carbonaria]|uniref:ChrR-like cupin domain-containing protein n=1 Tax=Zestomonas carbonaria TaxID=2762745 RepID=A0A7U7ERQ4_9GAMM|nr:2,4'-dihydroxyacetophenone dioxygenase family protein [Pseudomonas carbonaria]CAD5109938.1 hypothetical protein PSEWESI4_04254 [Pseudomonas carbonaria]